MMKRTLLTLFCVSLVSIANAQIAKWLIEPSYDNIDMAEGIDAIITDSLDTKVLWSLDGKRLAQTTNELPAFIDGRSVTTKPGTSLSSGIVKDNGELIPLDNFTIPYSFPFFSCKKLLIKEDRYYRFVELDGSINEGKFLDAYPFHNGYASCKIFRNKEKQKDPYLLLINENYEAVQFSFNGKNFDEDDIEYISSLNDENLAVLVIKHKLYLFNGEDGTISPVFATEDEINLKNQAKLDGDFGQCFNMIEDNKYVLTAKCGKNSNVSFLFDHLMKPISYTANEDEKVYKVRVEDKKVFSSPLRKEDKDEQYCIYWENKEILPAQFDTVSTCFDNKAFVQQNGKYGMLEIDKDANFSLKINKGNDIAFLHQKFETTIRVDMPTYILSDRTYLEIDPDKGVEIDKTSREKKNTENGNFVEYNCTLTIPENLPDEIKEITYPIQVSYNGLMSPIINHKVNAWFYKKFEVEEDDSQRKVEQGTLTFVFNIKNAKQDESIVKVDVSVYADTLVVQREEKMTETRYKYKVYGLNEGINNVVVQVLEQGCPPATFPFEVEYHKPVEKSRKTAAKEEKVIITKKAKEEPKPILEI